MKQMVILVPQGEHNLSSIVGTYKVFSRAEQYWQDHGHHPVFNITVAGNADAIDFHNGLFSVHPHISVSEVGDVDLVVIPALNYDYPNAIAANRQLVAWIATQYQHGAAIASFCTGAFLLAATGILDGRKCATHWAAAASFRAMFPGVELVADTIITDDQGIFTNGGAYSFLNLVLYLVEKYYDRQTAVFCAKIFEIDIDRSSQSPYIIFQGQKNHQDEVVKEAQAFIEAHAHDGINVEQLAGRFAVGRRNFDRRFKKATGNTPAEYSQRVRIEAAKKCLEHTRKTVNEVMYEVGYSDIKAFRAVFKKLTGLAPLQYRNKYNKEVSSEYDPA